MYIGTWTPNSTAPNELFRLEASFEELTEAFSTFEVRPAKDGEAMIPALFRPCPVGSCLGVGRKCGGGQMHRLSVNVEAMTMLGVDLDHLKQHDIDVVLNCIKQRGVRFWWWNTFSHAPPEDCRMRVIIPFAEAMPLKTPEQWRDVAWPRLMEFFGIMGDPSCSDPARLYYMPARAPVAAIHQAGFVDGRDFRWEEAFDGVVPPTEKKPKTVFPPLQIPAIDPTRPVNPDVIRTKLGSIRSRRLKRYAQALVNGTTLTSPPNKRLPGDPSRYEAWLHATMALAIVAEGWESNIALLEIAHQSYMAEIAESPDDFTDPKVIERLLITARAKMPAFKSQREAEREALKQLLKDKLGIPPGGDDEDEEAVDWKKQAIWIEGPDGARLKPCGQNLSIIFRHMWRGELLFNEFNHSYEIATGKILHAEKLRPIEDTDITAIMNWLAVEFGMVSLSSELVRAQVEFFAKKYGAYDPVKKYLGELQWDGKSRVDTFLEKYLNVSTKSSGSHGDDITEIIRTISRKWLIGAVARGLRPGCEMHNVLVLEGVQYLGKTTALKLLGGAFYSGARVDPKNKDTFVNIAESWIHELGELGAFDSADPLSLNDFFTTKEDIYRPPYGRYAVRQARRCVFVGTTNRDDYLRDLSGNRRYWPVRCEGAIDLERLAADRDQIFAEAVALFKNGEQWWLTQEQTAETEKLTALRLATDDFASLIEAAYLRKAPESRIEKVTTLDIATDVLLLDVTNRHGSLTRVGHALRRLGFRKNLIQAGGLRQWYYYAPQTLLTAPQLTKNLRRPVVVDHLKLVPEAVKVEGTDTPDAAK